MRTRIMSYGRICSFMLVACAGLVACATGPSGRADTAAPLSPVQTVDLDRYAGLWFEIARYPNRFQNNCEHVTAEYTLRPDDRIAVTNRCGAGKPRSVTGRARVIDGSGGARLAVNFSPIPLPAGRGNYWILYLDEAYEHALVGEPSGRYLWMLARTPQISADARAELEGAATDAGYTLARLKETEQP